MVVKVLEFEELYQTAKNIVRPRRLSEFAICGSVGAALVTEKQNVYTGVCIDAACGIGFCAEHSAIAMMVTAGESRIEKIVAVGEEGNIMPPCGRCRELISQINTENLETQVMISQDLVLKLKDLLPHDFKIYSPKRYI